MVSKETFDGIFQKAKNGKGIITVSYVNGVGSIALDNLTELFGVVIIDSWFYRSVIQDENYRQILSKIPQRTQNEKLRLPMETQTLRDGTKN